MKCPTCGADNEAGNRFCEQCGSRLDVAPGSPSAPASVAAPAAAATATCPSCGATVLPGEAFCDECGASLSNVAPAAVSLNDAPTVQAPSASSAPSNGQSVTCPACGHQNLPGDSFCDNCGASLSQPAAAPAAPPAMPVNVPPPAEPAPAAPAEPAASAPASVPTQADAPTAEHPVVGEPAGGDAQAAYDAEVARLNDEIGRQQKIIEQFEQMQSMFGAATPPAVTQGLNGARDAKARAEAELAGLGGAAVPAAAPSKPAPPAESAPVQAAESAPAQPAPEAPSSTVEVPPELNVPAPPPVAPAMPAESATTAPAPAASSAPRLVFDDGKQFMLPTDKRDLVIGREDPISGIFPEIDLTPYGGETGGVSRQHARLTNNNGQWTVTDLHSTNYTRVDGARVEPDVPVAVNNGARLQFGRVTMVFQS